jgi:hypothetical protein
MSDHEIKVELKTREITESLRVVRLPGPLPHHARSPGIYFLREVYGLGNIRLI